MKMMLKEEFITKARCLYGDKFDYSLVDYRGNKHKVKIICKKHGEFDQLANTHLTGHSCPECAKEISAAKRRQGVQKLYERVIGHPKGCLYTYPHFYNEVRVITDSVTVCCAEHGEFQSTPHRILRGKGCTPCGLQKSIVERTWTTDEFIRKAIEVHGDTYDYSRVVYTASQSPVEIICKEHGSFHQIAQIHILQASGCKLCGVLRRDQNKIIPFASFVAEAIRVHGNKYEYREEDYQGTSSQISVKCPVHGWFKTNGQNHLGGHDCLKCSQRGPSKGQLAVAKYIESLGEKVRLDFRYGKGHKREFDVMIEDRRFAVEYHGIWFHSTKYAKPSSHMTKYKDACNQGIRLVQVFSDEWETRQDQVKALLSSALGKLPKVGARVCQTVSVDSAIARKFYDRYHIQGAVFHGVSIGLEHEGELVAVMTFSQAYSFRGARQEEGVWELVRFASSKAVQGGASKLFKVLVESTQAHTVVSYSNNRLYTGGMYAKLGFKKVGESYANYTYVRRNSKLRTNKSLFQRRHLPKLLGDKFDPSKSEKVNCQDAGYYQVYDCGLSKWVWNTKDISALKQKLDNPKTTN